MGTRGPRPIHCCVVVTLLLATTALACNVPVCRYALQWWPSDSYRAVVVHDAPLSPEQRDLLKTLRSAEQRSSSVPCMTAEEVSADRIPEQDGALRAQLPGKRLPHLFLYYPIHPADPGPRLAWDTPFTAEAVSALSISPKRQELARRLLSGDSAVWIVLRSEPAQSNEATLQLLRTSLKKMEESLELPADPLDGLAPDQVETAARFANQLKIRFSILELDRAEPGESAFWSMLTRLDPELDASTGPIVVPVFGRGRALVALSGTDVREEAIAEVCAFLTGPCSCQVKESNPGTDLLLPVDWDAALEQPPGTPQETIPLVVPDRPTPELSPATLPRLPEPTATAVPARSTHPLWIGIGAALLLILTTGLLGSVWISRSGRPRTRSQKL